MTSMSLALYDQEIVRNNWQPSYSRLKTSVRPHNDQTLRTRSPKRNSGETSIDQVSKRERNPTLRGKVGEWCQWTANGQCSKGDSCSFHHDPASGNRCEAQRAKEQSSSPATNSNGGEIPSESSGNRGETPSDKRCRIPCRCRKIRSFSCNDWHPPACQNYKSETGGTYGNKCYFRHVEAEERPSKKSKKGGAKGSLALLKESIQLGCVSQESHPRKSILRKEGRLGSNHAVKFSLGTWHHIKNRERKGPIARTYS